jgi:hypothetical protein
MLSREELFRRIAELPPEKREPAIQAALLLYGLHEKSQGSVSIGLAGEEVMATLEQLPTLDEWRSDPMLEAWKARTPPELVSAWERQVAERTAQVDETMSWFEEE